VVGCTGVKVHWRRMMARSLLAVLLVLGVGHFPVAQAQSSLAPSAERERWQELSPDKRREKRREHLENLSASERQKLRSQVRRFNSMPTSKQRELCARFREDHGYLPPACQGLF